MRRHSKMTNSTGGNYLQKVDFVKVRWLTKRLGRCQRFLWLLPSKFNWSVFFFFAFYCRNVGGETWAVWSNDDLKAQWNSFADSHVTVLNCCLKVEPCRTHWCWHAQSPHQAENKTWKFPPLTETLNGYRPIYRFGIWCFCAVHNTWLIDEKTKKKIQTLKPSRLNNQGSRLNQASKWKLRNMSSNWI